MATLRHLPPPPPTERSSTLVSVLIVAALLIFVVVVLGVSAYTKYRRDFAPIDHSADTFDSPETLFTPAGATNCAGNCETTYSNASSGVKLTLPGRWAELTYLQSVKLPPANTFCFLSGDGGTAVFAKTGPDFLLTSAADARQIMNLWNTKNYRFEGERTVSVQGRDARVLKFSVIQTREQVRILVVHSGFGRYLLSVGAYPGHETMLDKVEASFPNALELP